MSPIMKQIALMLETNTILCIVQQQELQRVRSLLNIQAIDQFGLTLDQIDQYSQQIMREQALAEHNETSEEYIRRMKEEGNTVALWLTGLEDKK